MSEKPSIIKGGMYSDKRGNLRFVNDMNLEDSVNEKIRFPAEWWFDWNNLKPLL